MNTLAIPLKIHTAALSFRSGEFEEPVSKVSSQEPGRTWRDDLRHQPSYQYVIRPQIPSFP